MCEQCLRPRTTCLCRWVTPVQSNVELLILQHPLEEHHAKGSARMLHLCLPCSRLVVAERFEPDTLRALLYGPLDDNALCRDGGSRHYPVLLYPQTSIGVQAGDSDYAAPDAEALADLSRVRLVVLDGTWRKSRKMLHLNPLLQCLPRLPLTGLPPSGYRIRKTDDSNHLSTLEAACYALVRLEGPGSQEKFRPILDGFAAFVEQQAAFAGQDANTLVRS